MNARVRIVIQANYEVLFVHEGPLCLSKATLCAARGDVHGILAEHLDCLTRALESDAQLHEQVAANEE